MSDLLFSVVIPAYNYAHTLRRAVESVLKQPGDDYELLVINDGSPDETESLLVQLSAEYPGLFRYLTIENSGLAAVRNLGIDQTTGQYLIFLDADDAFCDDALELLRGVVKNNPGLGMAAGGHVSVNDKGQRAVDLPKIPDSPFERVKKYLLDKELSLSNGAVAIHRDIFLEYRYPEYLRNSEDISMFVHILANYSVVAVDGYITYIHKHHDSLRHNADLFKEIGLSVVDEVFDASRLSGDIMSLKDRFVIQRLLSLSRKFYHAGDKEACRKFFCRALKHDWKVVFKWSYCWKFIKSLV